MIRPRVLLGQAQMGAPPRRIASPVDQRGPNKQKPDRLAPAAAAPDWSAEPVSAAEWRNFCGTRHPAGALSAGWLDPPDLP